MNYVFKGFFESPDAAEAAYYALRSKQLVYDIEASDLSSSQPDNITNKIAYSLGGNTMMSNPSISGSSLSTVSLGNTDPRAAITPLLLTEKEASVPDACYLYGHCRKKDMNAVTSCLKRYGAISVLSSGVTRPSRMHH